MRTSRFRGRLSAFQVGLIALVVIAIATFLAFSKDIPFTKPYQLKARFENAPPIQKNQAVRIAGVDVGRVSGVEAVGGDSPAVTVTMKLDEDALPIHEDARIKVRPRIFFEGNLFFDLRPGTPGAGELESGATIPASQTSAPVQIDQVLGVLTTDTREDLRRLLVGYGARSTGSLNRARTTTRIPTRRARPRARRSTTRSSTRPTPCAAAPWSTTRSSGPRRVISPSWWPVSSASSPPSPPTRGSSRIWSRTST